MVITKLSKYPAIYIASYSKLGRTKAVTVKATEQ